MNVPELDPLCAVTIQVTVCYLPGFPHRPEKRQVTDCYLALRLSERAGQ
jgi:hypothetical protein